MIKAIDMTNPAHRAHVAFTVKHHVDMIADGDDYFAHGPFSEADLVELSFMSADIFDTDLLVTRINHEDRTKVVDGITHMLAAMFAAGFKAGAELYKHDQP